MINQIIKTLEAREKNQRKKYEQSKIQGDILKAEYHKGHLHEIETMLLIIQEE